jgi:hypothetical protein
VQTHVGAGGPSYDDLSSFEPEHLPEALAGQDDEVGAIPLPAARRRGGLADLGAVIVMRLVG